LLNPDASRQGTDGKARCEELNNIVGVTDPPDVIRKQV